MDPSTKPVRRRVYSACHACRARKIKCDGGRPICATCIRRGKTCEYDLIDGSRQGAVRFANDNPRRTNVNPPNLNSNLHQTVSPPSSGPSSPLGDFELLTLANQSPGGQTPLTPPHPDVATPPAGYPVPPSMNPYFANVSPGFWSSAYLGLPPATYPVIHPHNMSANPIMLQNTDYSMEPFGLPQRSDLNMIRLPPPPPTTPRLGNENFSPFSPSTSASSVHAAGFQEPINRDLESALRDLIPSGFVPLSPTAILASNHVQQNSDGWRGPTRNHSNESFLNASAINGNSLMESTKLLERLPEPVPTAQVNVQSMEWMKMINDRHYPPSEECLSQSSSTNRSNSSEYASSTDESEDTGYSSPSSEADFPSAFLPQPSLDYHHKTWWDSLLDSYGSDHAKSTRLVIADFTQFFQISSNFLSFINVPLFYAAFYTVESRERLQPSLALSVLALATLLKSSELGLGNEGREKAVRLRDKAQAALEASLNAEWITPDLAQAALFLTIFEGSCHPLYHRTRTTSILTIVDTILRSLGLLHLDAKESTVSRFREDVIPSIGNPHSHAGPDSVGSLEGGCSCALFKFSTTTPSSRKLVPYWLTTPGWVPTWSIPDARKEEQRRIVWCALTIATAHLSYLSSLDEPPPDLYVTKPWKFRVFFPGEVLFAPPRNSSSGSHGKDLTPKNTVWALHARIQLLYSSSLRFHHHESMSDNQKRAMAVQAWLETERIEATLSTHSCNIEETSMHYGKECLFIVRKLLSSYFDTSASSSAPTLDSERAAFWLNYQRQVLSNVFESLRRFSEADVNILASRPYFTLWFHGQIARYLSVWEQDHSLLIALAACKALLPAVEYLSALYPSPNQRREYMDIHKRLVDACQAAGEAIPPPPSFELSRGPSASPPPA